MTENSRENYGRRFKEVRSELDKTLKEFYSPVATHVNNFSPIENGRRLIGKRLAEDVIKHWKINQEWMNTGSGNMFLEPVKTTRTMDEADLSGVPYYSVNISEPNASGFNLLKETPEYYVNFRPFNDCDAYLPIYGDSMYPKYASGEIIAVREIHNPDVIQWGEAYLIVADDTANNLSTVKLLFEHTHGNKLVLRASNPNYKGDTIIERGAIRRMFLVKGKIMRNQL
ncbi:S24 family peptidase [Pedobacter sp. MR2016-24]|uniref:S24 family peptidase n=1 Tax=Pedobacter sp. MR2016-24 TaxID=2994466 RepID=UPI0022455367|nr:S24 family peptidase [Pedobacter sp. MR2016-24]MCX2485995.1 DNA-binding protein [Pedobacter sp. MR2016-24]